RRTDYFGYRDAATRTFAKPGELGEILAAAFLEWIHEPRLSPGDEHRLNFEDVAGLYEVLVEQLRRDQRPAGRDVDQRVVGIGGQRPVVDRRLKDVGPDTRPVHLHFRFAGLVGGPNDEFDVRHRHSPVQVHKPEFHRLQRSSRNAAAGGARDPQARAQ